DSGDQGVQVRRSADSAEFAATFQLCRDGNGVGGFASAVQVEDAVEHGLMCWAVEGSGLQDLDDVGDGILGQQHAAEDGMFGSAVLWRLAVETCFDLAGVGLC